MTTGSGRSWLSDSPCGASRDCLEHIGGNVVVTVSGERQQEIESRHPEEYRLPRDLHLYVAAIRIEAKESLGTASLADGRCRGRRMRYSGRRFWPIGVLLLYYLPSMFSVC